MIDANGILSMIDKKSTPVKNILFGTISSDLKVIFDGETQPSQKTIARIQYTPVAGDRVAIYKQGQIYIILGKLGDGMAGGEQYRQRIIQDILVIGQTITLDATWDTIDATIRLLYVSGLACRLSDIVAITPISIVDTLSCYFTTPVDQSIYDVVGITPISIIDSVTVTLT